MPFPGPWISPHTTRFGGFNGLNPPPDIYVTTYQGDTWDDARSGTGTLASQAELAYNSPAFDLHYLIFPFFTRYQVGQAFSWVDIPSLDPELFFPPYTDVLPERPIIGVEYEHTHGTILANPGVQVNAETGGGNLNLPDAMIDVYQFTPADTPGGPGFFFFDPAYLASLSAKKIGSVDSASGATLDGFTVSDTDTVVLAMAPQAQLTTPFPYATPDASGFQEFALLFPAFEYLGPRFRFLYAVAPPQRQYPRDDGLAISTRRSWPPPTSKQYGSRRGPTATYW